MNPLKKAQHNKTETVEVHVLTEYQSYIFPKFIKIKITKHVTM